MAGSKRRLQRNLFRRYCHFYYARRCVFTHHFFTGFCWKFISRIWYSGGWCGIDLSFRLAYTYTGIECKAYQKEYSSAFMVLPENRTFFQGDGKRLPKSSY